MPTIISSSIPQFPKESIPDGTNYLDSELHMIVGSTPTQDMRNQLFFHLQHSQKM